MDWSTILTIAVWIFFVIMMMRGGGCCGMGGHQHRSARGNPDSQGGGHSGHTDGGPRGTRS